MRLNEAKEHQVGFPDVLIAGLARVAAAEAECPLNSPLPRTRAASAKVCQRCGATPRTGCGPSDSAAHAFVNLAREVLTPKPGTRLDASPSEQTP